MSSRSGQSSSRASGGVTATGTPLDTLVVIGGDGRKELLSISWSYGSNGAGIPPAMLPLYGRLVVVTADLTAFIPASPNVVPVGVNADYQPGGLYGFGGRLVFDQDIVLGSGGGTQQQFSFPEAGNEGWVGTDSGPLSILLCAPQRGDGSQPTNIVGKMTIQYKNVYGTEAADGVPGYGYPKISRPGY